MKTNQLFSSSARHRFLLLMLLTLFTCGNAWGATENYSYADYKGQGTQSTGSPYTMTKTSSSIGDSKFYVASSGSYGQLYAGGTTTITPIGGGTITQVVLTASSSSYNGYQSGGTITASAGSVSGSGTTVTWTGTASSAFTLTHSKQIRWTSIVVTFKAKVTFNANGGSVDPTYRTQTTPTSAISLPTPTRDGYTCTGWYTASSGGAKRGNAGGSYTPSASETLYAQWESAVVTCDDPTGTSLGATTHATTGLGQQVLNWTGAASNYEIYYNASGNAPGDAPSATVNSAKTYTITNLAPGTWYWWVRSKCSESLKSDWVSGGNFTINGIKLTNIEMTPTPHIDFGTVIQGASVTAVNIKVTGVGLSSSSTITHSFDVATPFTATPASLNYNANKANLTVTPSTATAGEFSRTLTITNGTYSQTVTVTMNVVAQDIFIDALQNTSGYTEASPHTEQGSYGTTPTLTDKTPATEGTCEQQHWHFMGWITEAKYNAGTAITDGDLQSPTTASNTTYYAVWAKGSAGSSGSFTISASDITSGPASYSTTETKFTKLATNDIGYKNVSYNNANTPSNWAAQTRIQFKKDATNYGELYNLVAISGLTKIRIYEERNCASVLTIYTGTTSKATTSTLSWPGSATGTESLSISKSGGGTISFTSNYYDLNVSSGHTFFYIKNANSSVAYPIKIVVYYSTVTYSDYKANCCAYKITVGTPTKTGTGSGTVTFTSGGNAVSAGGTVETCSGETTITATVTPNPGHQCDAVSFSGGSVSVSPTIPSPFVPFDNAGATTYTLTFAQNTNATLSTTITFTQLQDKYYDYMHGNATITKYGNYETAPTLNSVTKADGCAGEHYKFIGWIPESDMNMSTGVPTTTANMVAGGATGKSATNTTYYAIWAEEVTP